MVRRWVVVGGFEAVVQTISGIEGGGKGAERKTCIPRIEACKGMENKN